MSASAYLVRGSDPLLRDRALDALIDELLGADDRSFALEEFTVPGRAGAAGTGGDANGDGGESASGGGATTGGAEAREAVVGAALNAASSPPFMTATRVVVLRDAGALTAGDVDAFVRYLADPLDTTALVFVAGGGTIPPALTKQLKAVGAVERAPDSEKTGDVLKETAHAAGVLLTNDAAKLITTHLADDAGRVVGLIDVLATARDQGVKLTADDVAPYLGEEGGVPSYQLTNAIEEGDAVRALEILHRLLTVTSAQQPKPMHPLQLMGTLLGYYRRVLRLDDPSIRSSADAIEALGGKVKEYPARKALGAARALGSDGLREAFDALAQADLDLKGSRGIPADAVMEVLVVRLARLSARSGPRR
ncbi:MAG: DNA polymerase III subunit delta [Acidimicrobiia bacterium]